jgi:hypothetical protein
MLIKKWWSMAKKRTKKEQRAAYELWRQSGLTGAEFCRQNHISTRSIWQWHKEFGVKHIEEETSNNLQPQKIKFYPLGKVNSNESKDSFLEITLPNGTNCKAYLSGSDINRFLLEILK